MSLPIFPKATQTWLVRVDNVSTQTPEQLRTAVQEFVTNSVAAVGVEGLHTYLVMKESAAPITSSDFHSLTTNPASLTYSQVNSRWFKVSFVTENPELEAIEWPEWSLLFGVGIRMLVVGYDKPLPYSEEIDPLEETIEDIGDDAKELGEKLSVGAGGIALGVAAGVALYLLIRSR